MNLELENIIIIIDSREKNVDRIKAVKAWGNKHGAIIEHSKLELCDYHILGDFRDIQVNLGIEAKSLADFATSYKDLSDKLARSYQLYDDVALFVESKNYSFTTDPDGFHTTITNPAVHNGDADVLPLAVYENMLASFQKEGVHVRQLRSEAHFPYAIANLLINIVKPVHTGLAINDKQYKTNYLNLLAKIPRVGFKSAQIILDHYPNMFWLCSASIYSLKDILGKRGENLYEFLRCHDLETESWRNGHHMDGTDVLMCPHNEGKPCSEVNAYQCIGENCKHHPGYNHVLNDTEIETKIKEGIISYLKGFPEGRTVDEICTRFNIQQGNDDKETFLEIIKEMACDNQITSTSSGLFSVLYCNNHHNSHPDTTILKQSLTPQVSGDSSGLSPIPATSYSHRVPNKRDGVDPQGTRNSYVPSGESTSDIKKLGTHDTSSHQPLSPPSLTMQDKGNDQQGAPIPSLAASVQVSSDLPFPAHSDTPDEELFGKPHTDWQPAYISDQPTAKMNLKPALKIWFGDGKPHTLQETVDAHEAWSPGRVHDMVIGGIKAGYLKKITDQKGKVTFQKIKKGERI